MQTRIVEAVMLSLVLWGACNSLAAPEEPATMTRKTMGSVKSGQSRSGEEVEQGRYLVDLLGCGNCHTDGALMGVPRPDGNLSGSQIGIAWYGGADGAALGIVYPRNLTPDPETGLGAWTDDQIARAIRGEARHGSAGSVVVMPWPTLSKLSDEDVHAIVAYLRTLPPVRHRVPENVEPGSKASGPYVEFGMRQGDGS